MALWSLCRSLYITLDSTGFADVPATVDTPETVFTFKMLKDFHAHTLASKKSTYDHYTALQKLTNNAFPAQTPVSNF
jgi:CxC2 like cysteine cluster associated with KDZ transposases